MNDLEKLQLLILKLEGNVKVDNGTWLDHLNPSQAFLTCIGAGPWKVNRRSLIQKQAVDALENNDLSQIDDVLVFRFPLEWQITKTAAMIDYLQRYKITMTWLSGFLSRIKNPVPMLYQITNSKQRAKVLDLFARDYLKAVSFPIDRHVAKLLKENNLPVDEDKMIELCKQLDYDAKYVARLFVNASGKFTGNVK